MAFGKITQIDRCQRGWSSPFGRHTAERREKAPFWSHSAALSCVLTRSNCATAMRSSRNFDACIIRVPDAAEADKGWTMTACKLKTKWRGQVAKFSRRILTITIRKCAARSWFMINPLPNKWRRQLQKESVRVVRTNQTTMQADRCL